MSFKLEKISLNEITRQYFSYSVVLTVWLDAY